MLAPASNVLPILNIDYERIELFRLAAHRKNFRVTPEILKQLKTVKSPEELFNAPSTSEPKEEVKEETKEALPTTPTPSRKNPKRRMDEDLKLSGPEENKCAHCGCRRLRVVDPRRPDGQRLLECTRSTCLASVKFTDLPVGTVIGKEPSAIKSEYNLKDRYYPTSDGDSDSDDQEQRSTIYESSLRGVFIDVPGQEKRARFMG